MTDQEKIQQAITLAVDHWLSYYGNLLFKSFRNVYLRGIFKILKDEARLIDASFSYRRILKKTEVAHKIFKVSVPGGGISLMTYSLGTTLKADIETSRMDALIDTMKSGGWKTLADGPGGEACLFHRIKISSWRGRGKLGSGVLPVVAAMIPDEEIVIYGLPYFINNNSLIVNYTVKTEKLSDSIINSLKGEFSETIERAISLLPDEFTLFSNHLSDRSAIVMGEGLPAAVYKSVENLYTVLNETAVSISEFVDRRIFDSEHIKNTLKRLSQNIPELRSVNYGSL